MTTALIISFICAITLITCYAFDRLPAEPECEHRWECGECGVGMVDSGEEGWG